MEGSKLETTETKTYTVEMTPEEAAVLGLNLLQLSMLERAGIVRMVAPDVMKALAKKMREAIGAASDQSGHDQSRFEAGSDGSTSSGEPAGGNQVPVSEA